MFVNIADDYAAARGGAGWHDMHCRLTGLIVPTLRATRRRVRRWGVPFAPISRWHRGPGAVSYRLLDNTPAQARRPAQRTSVIKAARSSVLIENAYFLPDRGLRRVMVRRCGAVSTCGVVPAT